MQGPSLDQRYIDTTAAAKVLGATRQTVARLCKAGRIDCIQLNRAYRVAYPIKMKGAAAPTDPAPVKRGRGRPRKGERRQ